MPGRGGATIGSSLPSNPWLPERVMGEKMSLSGGMEIPTKEREREGEGGEREGGRECSGQISEELFVSTPIMTFISAYFLG